MLINHIFPFGGEGCFCVYAADNDNDGMMTFRQRARLKNWGLAGHVIDNATHK